MHNNLNFSGFGGFGGGFGGGIISSGGFGGQGIILTDFWIIRMFKTLKQLKTIEIN